jgi:cytochrome c553
MIPAIRQTLNLLSCITLFFGTCTSLQVQFTSAQEAWTDDDFEKHIRPILIDRCAECHGPETQWGELRVDTLENLLAGGEHGPALVPGKPESSLMILAIERTGELKMPPENPLSEQEVALLKRWILQGAYWPKSTTDSSKMNKEVLWKSHWAFQPMQKVTPPEFSEEPVATPVDAFVVAQLKANGLSLSPATDKRTLIRRLYFSLIGLPPTNEEVQAFVTDNSPEAYSNLVERLLDHQAYGEHWGRLWLDVARYSDTKGYVYGREEKNFVHAYVYRDWVCRAFTEDMPYDKFLQLQLAADQLTEPGDPNRAAMGFLTLGRRFLGVSHDIIDDRIDAVSRGLLGVTVSCARCHDHKYDPIPTADYYSLYGVFLNSTERVERLNPHATTKSENVPASWEEELIKRQTALANKHASARQEASERMRNRITDYFIAQSELEKYPQEGFDQILSTNDLIPNLVRRLQLMLAAAIARNDRRFIAWRRIRKSYQAFKRT